MDILFRYNRYISNFTDPINAIEEKEMSIKNDTPFLILSHGMAPSMFPPARDRKVEAEKKKRGCKYPDCFYYKPDAKTYCCNGCSGDHYDYVRLGLDKKEKSNERKDGK